MTKEQARKILIFHKEGGAEWLESNSNPVQYVIQTMIYVWRYMIVVGLYVAEIVCI